MNGLYAFDVTVWGKDTDEAQLEAAVLGATATLAMHLPDGSSRNVHGSVAEPSLSLEQHASLCCEISAAPERTADALARYRVSPAQKQAADRHYAERFAREPSLREAWQRAFDTYRDWWTESARRRL